MGEILYDMTKTVSPEIAPLMLTYATLHNGMAALNNVKFSDIEQEPC